MKNINELIGIIKGINFDGVINEKEVLRLQSWVDKNRNLAYEKQQMKLIKMVDSILEDHIIDDSEKKLMITMCEEFLKDAGDNSSRIYELNEIIEGVVCDEEVNEAEVLHLKEWIVLIVKTFIRRNLFEKEKRRNHHPFQRCRILNLCCLCG